MCSLSPENSQIIVSIHNIFSFPPDSGRRPSHPRKENLGRGIAKKLLASPHPAGINYFYGFSLNFIGYVVTWRDVPS